MDEDDYASKINVAMSYPDIIQEKRNLPPMKTLLTVTVCLLLFLQAQAQTTLSLSDCYEKAEANYPLVRQQKLLETTKAFSVENASKGHLPQISLGGQATYQSDVTQIPIEMPGIVPLDKDQYRIFGEVSQTLYHGGMVRQRVRTEELNGEVEQAQLTVDLYQVKNRINDLFFGILLLRDQISQSALVKDDLNSALKKTEAGLAYGVAMRSAADVLRAELLRVDQRAIELEAAMKAYRDMLGVFIGQPLTDNIVLIKPAFTADQNDEVLRPELKLFDLQKTKLEASRSLLTSSKAPKLDLFVQAGYGRPALNMLENEFKFYYIGGIRLSWMLSGFYTLGKEKEIIALREQSLDAQKETFLFNTGLSARQQDSEIVKLRRLIDVDAEIITLRTRVKETASVQLEQGVITATDFVREVNAADQAVQSRVLHETQLLMAQAKYEFTTGH
jgi:outer membrane protein TolC